MILIQELGLKYLKPSDKYRTTVGLYKCPVCSKQIELSVSKVKTQRPTMCRACFVQKMTTHGESGKCRRTSTRSALYDVWASMLTRCNNPKHKAYLSYGGRGIKVCDEWKEYLVFKDWAIHNGYEKNLTLDRKDNDGNYTPANCRWVTSEVQGRNTRLLNSANTSGYRGVSYHTAKKKWHVSIRVHPKRIYLGLFKTAEQAALAYNNYVMSNKLEHPLNIIRYDKTPEEID